MLHIESPYGIYQTIDWVAQAQLCTVVGPERFLMLKTLNIRTIFDLQRAVLGPASDPNGTGPAAINTYVPDPELLDAIGDLLLRGTGRDEKLRKTVGLPLPSALQNPVGTDTGLSASARRAALIQLVHVMLDDLHVHRLRQLWRHIERMLQDGRTKAA
jgi:hypothetical protein